MGVLVVTVIFISMVIPLKESHTTNNDLRLFYYDHAYKFEVCEEQPEEYELEECDSCGNCEGVSELTLEMRMLNWYNNELSCMYEVDSEWWVVEWFVTSPHEELTYLKLRGNNGRDS